MVSVYGAITHARKARIGMRWRQGCPASEIARDISTPPATVYSYLLYHGGHRRVLADGPLWPCPLSSIARAPAQRACRAMAREDCVTQ